MRKIYLILASAAVALGVNAQQVPNSGFENGWTECVPWTSNGNKKAQGNKPVDGWWISQVIGMGGTGATTVGWETEGYNSTSAVLLKNSPNSILSSQAIPGYLTFGTPFSTAQGMQAKNPDGGCFGGTPFTTRPDAFSFYYKRTYGTANPNERAIVIAYSWKGHTYQASVPGNISLMSPTKVTMTDRDRNILGIPTAQGGAVTYSEDFALISQVQYDITTPANDWTQQVVEFEYKNSAAPEQINLFFCSGDFFDQTQLGMDNALYIDDIKMLYYSRLSDIKVNGTTIAGFTPGTYAYNVDVEMPDNASSISCATLGASNTATTSVTLNADNNTATITVSNQQGPDVDGQQSHAYTIQFKPKSGPVEPDPVVIPDGATVFTGTLVIAIGDDVVNEGDLNEYTVYTVPSGDGICDFVLPNFTMDFGGDVTNFGNIEVPNVVTTFDADGNMFYSGQRKGLQLLDGDLEADVDLDGKLDTDGNLRMDILVGWIMGDDTIPVNVTFSGHRTVSGVGAIVSDNNAPAVYYNLLGVRVDNPTNGVYIRRQGNTVTKVLVK